MRESTTKKQNGLIFTKKVVRDTYAQHTKQLTDLDKEKLNLEKIYNINFGEDALIIVSKQQIVIYSTLNMKIFYIRKGHFWDAFFIPNTNIIALVEHDGTARSRRTVRFLDLEKDTYVGSVTISFEIEQLKCSQNCILFCGTNQISVIHFPSLKPICHQLAGTGMKVICDISFQGLTLAYNCQNKGSVMIHNFSSVFTQQARRRSSNQTLKYKLATGSMSSKLENPKKIIQIKAHSQYITNIKLTPNGSRVATTSQRGTIIRIFLTENGKIWEELRVGYDICRILDLNFYEQGNAISCLTQKSMVFLFNVKLQPKQQLAQNQKRGYKIHQQSNPKSYFYFLSFFYRGFNNQFPFAFFKLVKPSQKNKEAPDESYSPLVAPNTKEEQEKFEEEKKKQIMEVVKEETQKQIIELEEQQLKQLPGSQKNIEETESQRANSQMPQNLQNNRFVRSTSVAYSDRSSKRKTLLNKISLMQAKKENYDYISKIYNTISKVFVGGNNFVWAVKGPYIFTLKYDPFNGGEMYHSETVKFC